MEFEWDEKKNQSNQQKHGLNFADAAQVFAGRTLTFEDSREAHGEARHLTVGSLAGRVVIIAHTFRGDATRIISMRKANARERARYQERLGPDR
jgi:uncharacterized DUF497 family protein